MPNARNDEALQDLRWTGVSSHQTRDALRQDPLSRLRRKRVADEMRDSQQSKVYSLEYKLFPTAYTQIDREEADKLVKRAARKFKVNPPPLFFKGPRHRVSGSYQSWKGITINCGRSPTVSKATVLHEFAHHVCGRYYGLYDIAHHGPEYVRCLVEVMKWAGHSHGHFNQRTYKVKIASSRQF